MPVLRSIRERFARERPLDGLRVGVCLHVTTETANLVRTLIAGGAEVGAVRGQPARPRRTTSPPRWSSATAPRSTRSTARTWTTYYRHIDARARHARRSSRWTTAPTSSATLHGQPHGPARRRLSSAAPRRRPPASCACARSRPQGSSASRSSPSTRRARSTCSTTATAPASRRSTGSCARPTCCSPASASCVFGYGWCGQGVALRAKGAGAQVIVCEVDPVRALEARHGGLRGDARRRGGGREGDVFITVTGDRDVRARASTSSVDEGRRDPRQLRPLRRRDRPRRRCASWPSSVARGAPARRAVRARRRTPHQPARARAAWSTSPRRGPPGGGDGHVSFANQALAAEHLAKTAGDARAAGLRRARTTSTTRSPGSSSRRLGVAIDALTDGQREYLTTWEQGT